MQYLCSLNRFKEELAVYNINTSSPKCSLLIKQFSKSIIFQIKDSSDSRSLYAVSEKSPDDHMTLLLQLSNSIYFTEMNEK